MATYTFTKAHDLNLLNAQLIQAIPALAPVNRLPVMALESRGLEITVNVPDAVTRNLVAAVVTAHDPAAVPLTPEQQAWATATVAGKLSMIAKRLGLEQ